jgi:transcriptional regulator with XRE-family HTH domain
VATGEADGTVQRTPRTPNTALRRVREHERRESQSQFAEAMAQIAREAGIEVYPDAQYVQRLESGHITWPHKTYRNILERLCGRPARELGFAPAVPSPGSGGMQTRVNVRLREAVWARGMEVAEFGRRVGVDPKTAERWITRGTIPQPARRWKASLILGIDESELWPESSLAQESPQDMPSVPVVSTAVIQGAEDVTDVLKRVQKLYSSTVHPDIICHLQENIRRTVTQYESLQHSIIVPALRKQRAWIESLLDECGHPVQRKQLSEVAGATSGILGYISVGSSDFALARAYCLEAFQLGDFAGNANLQAWARGLQSFCEYYAGRYDEALNLANDGLNYSQSGPQSVRLTINGKARAMGKLGDSKGVDRAVGEAYELMSLNDVPGGVPSSIAFECYSEAQTASNAATAYVSLAMPEKVQHYASLALPEISKSDSPWSRSLVMIDLAVSHVHAKDADLDHASTLVNDALAISAGRPVISVQQRTSEFVHDVISRWGNVPQARMIRDAALASIERGK